MPNSLNGLVICFKWKFHVTCCSFDRALSLNTFLQTFLVTIVIMRMHLVSLYGQLEVTLLGGGQISMILHC